MGYTIYNAKVPVYDGNGDKKLELAFRLPVYDTRVELEDQWSEFKQSAEPDGSRIKFTNPDNYRLFNNMFPVNYAQYPWVLAPATIMTDQIERLKDMAPQFKPDYGAAFLLNFTEDANRKLDTYVFYNGAMHQFNTTVDRYSGTVGMINIGTCGGRANNFNQSVAAIGDQLWLYNWFGVKGSEEGTVAEIWGFELMGTATRTPYFGCNTSTSLINFSTNDIARSLMEQDFKPWDADPYDDGGDSDGGGGEGDFDDTSDDIDFPPLPTLSATDAGFITLFNPTLTELQNLASYMWSSSFDLTQWRKLFADPMDCILGLSIVPVNVPSAATTAVQVGNINTGITMHKASSQYVEVDCGTLNVNEYWGAYLDYAPFTKAELYLPYCGIHPIDVDDIMGKSVHIKYHVDVLSGACTAYVKCGSSILYSFVGNCAVSVPVTSKDWTNMINGVIQIGASIGTMAATGGATAPTAIVGMTSTAVNSMKPSIEKSGAMGSAGGLLGVQTPYLILTRPRQAKPANQNKFLGYPSFITMNMADCTGYTEVEKIHLENIPATDNEKEEIDALLKGGVLF